VALTISDGTLTSAFDVDYHPDLGYPVSVSGEWFIGSSATDFDWEASDLVVSESALGR
jgi:hypothetical protein